MPSFLIYSKHPDFEREVHPLNLDVQELKGLLKSHRGHFLAIYGTDPHPHKIDSERVSKDYWVKTFGITRQDNISYVRRSNFLKKLEKIPDLQLVVVNPTVWYGIGPKQRSQELDFIMLSNDGTMHLAEFMSNDSPREIKQKLSNIHKTEIWRAAANLIKEYGGRIKRHGHFYFFVNKIPELSGEFPDNLFFVKYDGHPDEADFKWKPIPFKE